MIKKAASRAFIICGALLIIAMVVATIYAALSGTITGQDIWVAPLLGFYTGVFYFIFVYPCIFAGLLLYGLAKNR